MDAILPGAPWLIAHRAMLGINKPLQITLNGCDYVLWQNQQGEVFALNNVCPHMQAPLAKGWICQSRNTIACPFHALEFDGQGRLLTNGEAKGKPVAKTLDLIIENDLIWTYGGFEPRLPIPKLIPERTQGLDFMGIAENTCIQASFLNCIKINYDFNHQNGTHRETLRIQDNPLISFEKDGYYARVAQTFIREKNTIAEIIQNPSFLNLPIKFDNELEYTFPSTSLFKAKMPTGEVQQVFILYPRTESETQIFVMCYGKLSSPLLNLPGLKQIMVRSLLKATAQIVQQDTQTVESLYPRQEPQIRLPKEDIMAYVERLYLEW